MLHIFSSVVTALLNALNFGRLNESDSILSVCHNRPLILAVSEELGLLGKRGLAESVGESDDGATFDGEADEFAVDGLVVVIVIFVAISGLDSVSDGCSVSRLERPLIFRWSRRKTYA